MKKRIIAILLALLALASLAGCEDEAVVPQLKPAIQNDYDTAVVQRGYCANYKQYPAYVQNRMSNESFQQDGIVGIVHVAIGDHVEEGQILAELNMSQAQSGLMAANAEIASVEDESGFRLQQLELKLREAEILLSRMTDSAARDEAELELKILQLEYDHISTSSNRRIASLRERAAIYQQQLDGRYLYASATGTVVSVSAGFTPISAGTTVVSIAVDNEYVVRYDEDSELARNTCRVDCIINGTFYNLEQYKMPQNEMLSYSYQGGPTPAIFFLPEEAQVESGDFVMLSVYAKEMEDVLFVPVNAFYRSNAFGGYVYRIVDGEKVYTDVSCLLVTDTWAVLSGVEEGDVVFVKQ